MRRSGLTDPGPQFSGSRYLGANRDVAAAGLNPLMHYILDGWAQGRPLQKDAHAPLDLPRTAVLGARDRTWLALREIIPRRRLLRPEPGPDPAATIRIRPPRGAMPTGWCRLSAERSSASLLVTSGGRTASVDVPAQPRHVLVRLPDVPAQLALRRSDRPGPQASRRPVIFVTELGSRQARNAGPACALQDESSYTAWIERFDTPDAAQRGRLVERARRLARAETFRVLGDFDRDSLDAQIYRHWTTDPARQTEFVVHVERGATLAPHALLLFAEAIAAEPGVDALYADEDLLVNGVRRDPWFKPDYCPEQGCGVFGAVRVVRRSDPAARSRRVMHLPHLLSHATTPPGLRHDRVATPQRPAGGWPSITAIIPTRDHASVLAACLDGLLDGTDYPALDILVADNGSLEPPTRELLDRVRARGVGVLPCPGPFNFSAINNRAAAQAAGELLLFLNNDITMPDPGWLKAMASLSAGPGIGAVGAKLLYPDGTLQHGGVVLGMGGVAGHVHLGAAGDDPGYFGRLATAQEVSAVTAACLLMPARHFAAVGGFDAEHLAVAFNDVDLCLRLRRAGLRVLWTPQAVLHHWESKSRGSDLAPARRAGFEAEIATMQTRWADALWSDPFFSPNLSLETTEPALAFPPRVERPWD